MVRSDSASTTYGCPSISSETTSKDLGDGKLSEAGNVHLKPLLILIARNAWQFQDWCDASGFNPS